MVMCSIINITWKNFGNVTNLYDNIMVDNLQVCQKPQNCVTHTVNINVNYRFSLMIVSVIMNALMLLEYIKNKTNYTRAWSKKIRTLKNLLNFL